MHDRFRTPWKSTILTGVFVATLAALIPLRILADLVNIGTLLAFVMVCAAVLIMRRTNPHLPRPFRTPLVPLLPQTTELPHTTELPATFDPQQVAWPAMPGAHPTAKDPPPRRCRASSPLCCWC